MGPPPPNPPPPSLGGNPRLSPPRERSAPPVAYVTLLFCSNPAPPGAPIWVGSIRRLSAEWCGEPAGAWATGNAGMGMGIGAAAVPPCGTGMILRLPSLARVSS